MSGPAIRPARSEDAPAIAAILGGWVRETGWMPRLHSADEDLHFARHLVRTQDVLVAGNPPQGFLARNGEDVTALYLAPGARGRGTGRALLDAAKAESPRLALWTFAANAGARAFYAREGFTQIGGTPGENDEGLPDIRLQWTAPAAKAGDP
ncbi:GNAT family N-acetyltransferase [Wenxinia saemankumensis]|uniref:L-amino acid N-acyltransferase YncA n=1 Tax=Wenxinia saemankumensis TaxID=1447782 RepID=A0A1M6CCU5_9RHOB|nr:GNAT family N-acetyltransferase [Wenxinia saemankumensis]SHI58703.1 L-amino acid N-acyltransferase YncA [Wenxinia saemankumensis]